MRRENEKLIIDGNAIYELDLECVRRKNQQKDKENEENQRKKNEKMK
ncbi:unknown [Ruminococcus sp. CAG:60]|nr:unknown [Ruminococcus sp. CAG:60]